MKEIIFVTTNKGKIASAEKALKDIKVLPFHAELIEPRSDDIHEIAIAKVKQAYNIVKKPCIALDAGFYIDHWHGFPKAYVNPTLETLGLNGILKLMDGVENRQCEFRQCLAYYDGTIIKCFESISKGKLSTDIRGENLENKWSELWSIFIPEHFDKTLSEFDDTDRETYQSVVQPSSISLFGKWYQEVSLWLK